MTKKKTVARDPNELQDFNYDNQEMVSYRDPETYALVDPPVPAPESGGIQISEDGYLLQKVIPASKVVRVIDWKSLGITSLTIQKSSSEKYGPDLIHPKDVRKRPTSQEDEDRFFVTELCHPYNPKPDDNDVFVYYDDIQFLSGTAGYLRIRDGYVQGHKVVSVS